jgi:hypothetical protein
MSFADVGMAANWRRLFGSLGVLGAKLLVRRLILLFRVAVIGVVPSVVSV